MRNFAKDTIKKIKGIFPVTVSEAVYTAPGITLKSYLDVVMHGIANVKSFGAIGDGKADDTIAIQRAIDSLSQTGGTIIFPPGVYKTSTHITYYSNQKLVFNCATMLRGLPTQRGFFISYNEPNTGKYDGTHDVEIIGAKFDMGDMHEDVGGAIFTAHAQRIKIKDCTFHNLYGSWHYIEINSSKDVSIENCWFGDLRTTSIGAELIQIDGTYSLGVYPFPEHIGQIDQTCCHNIRIRNNTFQGRLGKEFSPCIGCHTYLEHTNIYIYGNTFRDFVAENHPSSKAVIHFEAIVRDVYVYDNSFINFSKGIVTGAGRHHAYNNVFEGNHYALHAGVKLTNNYIEHTRDGVKVIELVASGTNNATAPSSDEINLLPSK